MKATTYTKMTEKESIAAFRDGAKMAASAAREMAEETQNPDWTKTAEMIDAMGENGYQLARMRAMSRKEQLDALTIKAGGRNVNVNPLAVKREQ